MERNIKKVYIISNGCHESYMDASIVQNYFKQKVEFVLSEDFETADIILILGCSVMQTKENETLELAKLLNQRKKNNAKLLLTGCISKVRPELAKDNGGYGELLDEIDNILRLKKEVVEIKQNFPYRPYRGEQRNPIDMVKKTIRNEMSSINMPDLPLLS